VDENPEPMKSGWTFGKVIGLTLGVIGIIGFGLFTLCALIFASWDGSLWWWVVPVALMTSLSVWPTITMVRKARAPGR
jgi:hypothetical protein